MKRFDHDLIARLQTQSAICARGRTNHNFHQGLQDPIQRFVNAMQPDSYVQPHQHPQEGRWEWFLIVQGRALVFLFDDHGRVTSRDELCAQGPLFGVEIPAGAWHTLLALAPGALLFEVKPGPYRPQSDKRFASWAPGENDAGVGSFLAWLKTAQPGDGPFGVCGG